MINSLPAKQHCAASPRGAGRPGALLLQLLSLILTLSLTFVVLLYCFNSLS